MPSAERADVEGDFLVQVFLFVFHPDIQEGVCDDCHPHVRQMLYSGQRNSIFCRDVL